MTLLPDIKETVISALAAALPDVQVMGAVPDDLLSRLPLVAVFEPPGPGSVLPGRIARSAVSIQAYAATPKTARDTCHRAYDALHTASGATVDTVVIQSVADITSPGENHDPGYPDAHRWTCSLEIRARHS